ncbi:MAG: hypothetical protein ABIG61_08370 [Planctomycetota bacterium]
MKQAKVNKFDKPAGSGIVLVLTLVVLVAVAATAYSLTSKVSAYKHRTQYMIDYQQARYACDSAMKYAFARVESLDANLISRPNEPDFSDIFAYDQNGLEQYLDYWVEQRAAQERAKQDNDRQNLQQKDEDIDFNDSNSVRDLKLKLVMAGDYDINDINDLYGVSSLVDDNSIVIRGPYGPHWPLVIEPIELEIGEAKVVIRIEDENAKQPMSWGITGDKETQREAEAALATFFEWMGYDQTEQITAQLSEISEIKKFKLDLKDVKVVSSEGSAKKVVEEKTSRQSRRSRRRTIRRASKSPETQIRPAIAHTSDFARLFHSSLLDSESLARPTIETEDRRESTLKYMGLWGTQRVNINTAPRHVLESAFSFGGDAEGIADNIIKIRRMKPISDVNEARSEILRFSDSFEKAGKYITTESTFFTIWITATSGSARASAVAAVKKQGEKTERIGVIYD